MRRPSRSAWKRLAASGLAIAALALGGWYLHYRSVALIEVLHLPTTYSRRTGDLSANVSLRLDRSVRSLRFRVNGGEWRDLDFWTPRTPAPLSSLEMLPGDLSLGENEVTIEAGGRARPAETISRKFRYDPSPIKLPIEVGWQERDLEAQDGTWERVERDGVWRVRPRPGYEGYDRILLVSGSLPVDRRIETDVIFRHHTVTRDQVGAREFAFGVLSLWGGHPDDGSHYPRRGWNFAMGWYWSKPGGVGNEISFRDGASAPAWVNGYRDEELIPGVPYRLVIEVRDERDALDHHVGYHQTFKWWRADLPPPQRWMELDDVDGAPLPEGEYAVALLAFNCQVEFGPVRVLPLP